MKRGNMPHSVSENFKDLFQRRAFAGLATLRPDGPPKTPVWADCDGALVVVNSARGRVKEGSCGTRSQVAAGKGGIGEDEGCRRDAEKDHQRRRRDSSAKDQVQRDVVPEG